jgi:hypothetical protein
MRHGRLAHGLPRAGRPCYEDPPYPFRLSLGENHMSFWHKWHAGRPERLRPPRVMFGQLLRREGLVEIGEDVVDVLDAHADADQVFRHARGRLFGVGELLVGG